MGESRAPSQIIGLTLNGRYRVVEPISNGAMGAVFRAIDANSGDEVAVKQSLDRRHERRFEAEARLLESLRHPRVVEVIDYFNDKLGQHLVMELVKGIEVGVLLKQRGDPGLPVADSIDYVRQLCEALHYVHGQQIIHRDVKPQNMILSEQGIVLVDFGIAREMDEDETPGTVGIGTPRFMAPEVFAGGRVSPRTDVFGAAATLWTLLTGRAPVYAEPKRLSELVPEVPPELETTIHAGLEMIPERRIASAAAFAAAIGAPLGEDRGESLALSIEDPDAPRNLMEAIVRAAAGVFGAAASSVCLIDITTRELVYQSAWGAGAREIVGVRLPPRTGIAGRVVASGAGEAIADCRADPRFAAAIAAGTGYVPHTMLVVPLLRGTRAIGALSVLDRRDGRNYHSDDVDRAGLFAEVVVKALDVTPGAFTSLGMTVVPGARHP